jgi:hypothetical protein
MCLDGGLFRVKYGKDECEEYKEEVEEVGGGGRGREEGWGEEVGGERALQLLLQ